MRARRPDRGGADDHAESHRPRGARDRGPVEIGGMGESPFVVAVPGTGSFPSNSGGGFDAPAAHIAVSELASRLQALPASGWKDGKKVGLQSQSIVANTDDAAKVARNLAAAETILKDGGYEVVPFPSG